MTLITSLQTKLTNYLTDFGLLAIRIFAGYEFLAAGLRKASGTTAPSWFAGLDFPFPHTLLSADINWNVAAYGEIILGALLIIGLFGRFASLGLLYITYIAIYTVHFDLGFAGWNQIETDDGQGFKVPLMLAIMLFTILTQGSGKWSITQIIKQIKQKKE